MAEIRVNATGELKLYDSDDSNYVSFKSGGTVSSDVTWTLPTADGSNGQALTTNGSGTLSWADAGSSDPSSADGDSLGTASAEWSDLYLADAGVIYFGNDQDITLTHVPDTGLILGGTTPTLTIGDAGAEDTRIVFDGNAQDFHIGLDDSADDLVIGVGSALGTTTALAIDENAGSTFSGTVTVGVDDTGKDVKFFGATSGSYFLWDESADTLQVVGDISFGGSGNTTKVGGGGATPTYSMTNNGEGITLKWGDDSGARYSDIVAIGNNPAGATSKLRFWVNPNSTDNATEHFRIAGDGTLTATDTSIGSNSDERLKKNIANFTYDISKFKQLQPRTFDWKNPLEHNGASGNKGFIAQEIKAIDDYLIDEIDLNPTSADYDLVPADEKGVHKAYTSKLGKKDAMYISVIKQLITRIEALEG